MKRKLAILLFAGILCACSGSHRKYVIGVSQCSEDIWRDQLKRELITGQYVHENIELRFASADDNDQRQIEQIAHFIREGVDLLIVSPNQQNTLTPIVDKAYDHGIPVILFDRKTNSDKYTAFIGADNFKVGYTMGTLIGTNCGGRGKVVEIMGLKGSSPAIERHRGFMAAMRRFPGMTVVVSEQGDWTEESGRRAMEKILREHQDLDCVFGQNDRLAMGARRSVAAHGIRRPVIYYGVDGLPTPGGGVEMVNKGLMTASYIYPTRGTEVMQLAANILEGKPFRRDNPMQAAIVTKDNAAVLLMQHAELDKQAKNINTLHGLVDTYFDRLSTQRILIIMSVIIIILLVLGAWYVFRAYLMKSRLNAELSNRNDELQQLTHEVEEMTQAQLTFFTNVSHELRTPLTLIAEPVEQLLADGTIRGEQHSLLALVHRNVNVLMQLVNDILDFRKVQNGKMPLRLSRFDMREALTSWTDDFRVAAAKKKISLSLHVEDGDGYVVTADRSKIERIFTNLMGNALKFTPSGGHVGVDLRPSENGQIRLSVTDSGIGIDTDELPRVFERFFQTRHSAGGTGIGLALVKAFTELHHGQVSVRSEKDRGSEFSVVLPKNQEGEIAEPQQEEPRMPDTQYINGPSAEESRAERVVSADNDNLPVVLIIDDNNDMRSYIHTVLQGRYRVIEAADGLSGMEIARSEVPDLVVSDVMMPMMDGIAFCHVLKSDAVTSHVPVILLTARTLDEQRIEGYESGADAYLTKPFSPRLLLARIDNLLKSRAALRRYYTQGATGGDEWDAMIHARSETEQAAPAAKDLHPAVANHQDRAFIDRFRKIIQDNLSDSDLSVERIGAEIGLSRVQLYRKVKALTGFTPVELIRKARLNRARKLLATTGMNVSEVAYAVGFSAPSYFSKCFKEEFGVVPGEHIGR